MNKLWIDYSPDVAKCILEKGFRTHPDFLKSVRKLSRCYISTLAALCDGKTVTTLGNLVEADYAITRASAVIQFLRKEFAVPITRELKVVSTDCGMKARQALYKIEASDLALLKENLTVYIGIYDAHRATLAKKQAKRYMQRLVMQFGREWVSSLLEDISHDSIETAN